MATQSSAAVNPATRTAVETLAWLIEEALEGDPDHSILGSLRDLAEESWTALLQRALGRVRSARTGALRTGAALSGQGVTLTIEPFNNFHPQIECNPFIRAC